MTPRIGDVWQHPNGDCFRVLKVPRHMKPFFSDYHVYGIVYAREITFRIGIGIQLFLNSHKLIYRKPSKYPLNKSDEEFYKDVHDQIKCL